MTTGTTPLGQCFPAAMRHVEHMRAQFPNRKSGLGVDLAAGRYVVDTMRTCGLEAELQEFETFDSDAGTSFVTLGDANGPALASLPCLHVEPTPDGGTTAELVDVGPGGVADYAGKDVRGKIVLAEVSYAPATPEKARIAAVMGACGIVLMNWGADDSSYIPWRALKAVWGNPTPDTFGEIPRLFGVSISRADGLMLRHRMQDGPVSLHVRLTASRLWRTLAQPLAWLRAPETAPERDQFVIVSGHIDSWDPGVTDNIAGMAAMLEIARTLAGRRHTLRRSVVFCFWNGHEVAEAAGSTYFVDSLWERINRDAVAYFNIDSIGMRGAREFHVSSCPELAAFSERVSRAVFADTLPQKVTTLRRVGDQSFFGIGVSAATGRHSYDAETVAAQHGATLGWYNHTEFDTIDVMDPAALESDLEWCARYVHELLTVPVLPHRFAPRVADMRERFAAILPEAGTPPELRAIAPVLAELGDRVAWFDGFLDDAETAEAPIRHRANRLVLRLSRLLTFPTASASGRYAQDSYGVSTLAYPVPRLADLDAFRRLDRSSPEAILLSTRLMRQRHEITDALQAGCDLIDDFRALSGRG